MLRKRFGLVLRNAEHEEVDFRWKKSNFGFSRMYGEEGDVI